MTCLIDDMNFIDVLCGTGWILVTARTGRKVRRTYMNSFHLRKKLIFCSEVRCHR